MQVNFVLGLILINLALVEVEGLIAESMKHLLNFLKMDQSQLSLQLKDSHLVVGAKLPWHAMRELQPQELPLGCQSFNWESFLDLVVLRDCLV